MFVVFKLYQIILTMIIYFNETNNITKTYNPFKKQKHNLNSYFFNDTDNNKLLFKCIIEIIKK